MNRKALILIFLLLVVSGLFAAIYRTLEANKSKIGIPLYKEATVYINGRPIKVEVADNSISRQLGLSNRTALAEGRGMLFVFDGLKTNSSFWMKGMKFPIDIVWIADGKVVGTSEGLLPETAKTDNELKRYSPPEPVDMVLEVNAGTVPLMGIKVGSSVSANIKPTLELDTTHIPTPKELSGQKN